MKACCAVGCLPQADSPATDSFLDMLCTQCALIPLTDWFCLMGFTDPSVKVIYHSVQVTKLCMKYNRASCQSILIFLVDKTLLLVNSTRYINSVCLIQCISSFLPNHSQFCHLHSYSLFSETNNFPYV